MTVAIAVPTAVINGATSPNANPKGIKANPNNPNNTYPY
jgi:hypothetical protein